MTNKKMYEHEADGSITVKLVSSLTRYDLTKEENMMVFVCSEAVEPKLVQLETSCSVILPPTKVNTSFFLKKMGHSRLFFLYFHLFNAVDSKCSI